MIWLALLACAGTPDAVDADGDGFDSTLDCDDANEAVNPDASEVCNDIDDNCDVRIDEPQAEDAHSYWIDADGDGYGDPSRIAKACDPPVGWATNGDDCDDAVGEVSPAATEVAGNGIDDDCDGTID